MESRAVGRREVLRGAGVAAGGVAIVTAGLAVPASADDGGKGSGLLGGWMVTRTDDADGTTAIGVATFASGGATMFQDINPAGPAFSGAFAQRGRKRFRTTLLSGSGANEAFPDTPALTQEVRAEGTVDKDMISGTYTAKANDAATGEQIGATATGTFTGTRIVA